MSSNRARIMDNDGFEEATPGTHLHSNNEV
jgi:hypothetical protein